MDLPKSVDRIVVALPGVWGLGSGDDDGGKRGQPPRECGTIRHRGIGGWMDQAREGEGDKEGRGQEGEGAAGQERAGWRVQQGHGHGRAMARLAAGGGAEHHPGVHRAGRRCWPMELKRRAGRYYRPAVRDPLT